MTCVICETRRPKRDCPGVRGAICTVCCGKEREVTVDCPLDCEYLRDARQREKPAGADPKDFPNQDIKVSERFLRENETLLVLLGKGVVESALSTPGMVDSDVREGLDGLIRTYRTLQSGLIYESRPANPLAGQIYTDLQALIAVKRQSEDEQGGVSRTRDASVLGVLAFLQRLELDRNNGRRRGRAFIDFLRGQFPASEGSTRPDAGAPLIVT